MMTLLDFLKKIANLDQANVPGKGIAPHKRTLQGTKKKVGYTRSQKSRPLLLHSYGNACCIQHRAFNAGLISLTEDYTVTVKESETAYSMKKLEGKKIRLPKEERFWPGLEWGGGSGGGILI